MKMGKTKEINIRNWSYHLFNDMINIVDLIYQYCKSKLTKNRQTSYKDIGICNIGYNKIKNWWLWKD